MVVKVTDASGNPIAGKPVNWQLVFATPGSPPEFDLRTFTDTKGLAFARLSQLSQLSSVDSTFLQSVISATVDTASVNFTVTQALSPNSGLAIIDSDLITPYGTVLAGPAGSTGTIPIQIHIVANGTPVPNVSVRILSPVGPDPAIALPSASCATGPGADPGSVLTDASGNATCYPVFGKPFFPRNAASVSGPVSVLVGGLDPAQFDQTISPRPLPDAVWYERYNNAIELVVTPVTPGSIGPVSGNNQSVDPGKSSEPLVVQVTDLSGTVSIGNANVLWTVSPASAAKVSPSESTTDAQGKAQTTVTFAANAGGRVTVTATLSGSNSVAPFNFTLDTRVLIFSLTKIAGDLQTAQSGQNFGAPLIVQVMGTNGLPLSNQPVSFFLNPNVTLSATTVLTDASGFAQITVKAGSTPGPVTLTASIGSFTQPFTLTIVPPGPALSSSTFYNAAGGSRLSAVSPCSLVTVVTSGLAPNVQGLVFNANAFGPWATTLASDTVTVNDVAAPVYSVGNVSGVEQVTFQVPCETAVASSAPISINVGGGVATVTVPVQAATPGIFETLMSDGVRRAVVIRPDGTFVSLKNPAGLPNPARPGEVVRVFVTGLGPTAPAMATGAFPFAGVDSLALGQVIVGVNNAGARVVSARVSPNLIGVYEVAFQVPTDAPIGNDVVLSVAVNAPGDGQTRFSNGSKLLIQK